MDSFGCIQEKTIKLAGGWRKIVRFRQSGKSHGAHDLYIITPEGKKLRATTELCEHIAQYNYFDSIDPHTVNFEKPYDLIGIPPPKAQPRRLKEFIKFVESKGAYWPKLLEKRNKEVKVCIKMSKNSLKRCKRCSTVASASEKFEEQQDGSNICQECLCPDPYETLTRYFARRMILPQTYDLDRLKIQTQLSRKEITDFYFKLLNQTPCEDGKGNSHQDDITSEAASFECQKNRDDNANQRPIKEDVVVTDEAKRDSQVHDTVASSEVNFAEELCKVEPITIKSDDIKEERFCDDDDYEINFSP